MDSGRSKEACGPWEETEQLSLGVQIPHAKEQFLGERTCRDVPDDTL